MKLEFYNSTEEPKGQFVSNYNKESGEIGASLVISDGERKVIVHFTFKEFQRLVDAAIDTLDKTFIAVEEAAAEFEENLNSIPGVSPSPAEPDDEASS